MLLFVCFLRSDGYRTFSRSSRRAIILLTIFKVYVHLCTSLLETIFMSFQTILLLDILSPLDLSSGEKSIQISSCMDQERSISFSSSLKERYISFFSSLKERAFPSIFLSTLSTRGIFLPDSF